MTRYVPFNGDQAHRLGFCLLDNPWADHEPGWKRWVDDWRFRHKHALPTAPDAEGGRLRPTELSRAEGV